MRTGLTLIILLMTCLNIVAQDRATINGYVRDASDGEELIGVTVVVEGTGAGAITNAYGFYSITIPQGEYNIIFSYVGYDREVVPVQLNKNQEMNIELTAEVREMEEVVISERAIDANVTDLRMSRVDLNMNTVKKLPALFGEPDVIKTIQLLPGVITAGEGTSSFFVRGGSADQNLILIDEAPVYDPSHLFGLFSIFNADVLKDAELYKGGIPPRFGGRLSSILDVRTKDGNNKKFAGNAGIGSLASRLMIEGPIKKDKSSYIISGRRSYVDLFLRAAGEENLVYFYDVNAKVNWRHNNNNRFFAAVYLGRDVFTVGDNFSFGWGNATATFRWNHLFNDRLFSNLSLIASNFDYELGLLDPVQGFSWTSNLRELTLKQDLAYFISPEAELEFGYHVTYRGFAPGKISPADNGSIFLTTELQKQFALDHALYANAQTKVSPRLSLNYGLRLSLFQNLGPFDLYSYDDPDNNVDPVRTDTTFYGRFEPLVNYLNLEPRVSARFLLDDQSALKASYNRMVQNTHLIASGTVPLPFNTWSPSSPFLEPQIADQVAVGYFRNLRNNELEFSVEAYYKDMDYVTDFADNAQIFFNEDLATEFRQGDSWSYGLEFFLQKKEGDLTGFASYTWSRTFRHVPDVNLDRTFFANYDRRHTFNVVGAYDLNQSWSFGGNFTYSTGRPITLPSGRYEFGEGFQADLITDRNSYRLPAFHRLDLSATYSPKKNATRRFKSSWVFSIYNVYSRKNPFTIYTRIAEDEDGNIIGDGTQKEARLIYLFPILPSITYNVNF